jgi:hypothetical protein
LIRIISHDNPLWRAPRIHGELLKLGIEIAQSTVAKYMSRRHGPRSPGWQAFLRNHTTHIAGIRLVRAANRSDERRRSIGPVSDEASKPLAVRPETQSSVALVRSLSAF